MSTGQEVLDAARALVASLEGKAVAAPARNLEWLVGLLVLILVAVIMWDHFKPAPAPVGQWGAAETSKLVKDVMTEQLKMSKTLTVYAPAAKQKLKLPPEVQNDPDKYVLAASTVKPSLRSTTVTDVVDKETGVTTTLTRTEPYPLIAALQTGEVRVDYGYKRSATVETGTGNSYLIGIGQWQTIANTIKMETKRVARFTLREDLVQIKGVNLGGTLSVDSDRDGFIGVGAGYRW